jgi:uroporphyrinogen-III synthase
MRLIITRPIAQAQPWVRALQQQGVPAAALPLMAIAPLADTSPLQRAWAGLSAQALVMFVSANAVQQFFAAQPKASLWPRHTLAASTGPGTTAALVAAGVPAAQVVAPAADAPRLDSEALWAQLAGQPWTGRRVLVVRGEAGRDWLAEQFGGAGAQVAFLAAYQRVQPVLNAAEQALLSAARAQPAEHLWWFTSGEALQHLQALVPGADWSLARAWASHPRIQQAVLSAGFGRALLVPATVEAACGAWAAETAAALGTGQAIDGPAYNLPPT